MKTKQSKTKQKKHDVHGYANFTEQTHELFANDSGTDILVQTF